MPLPERIRTPVTLGLLAALAAAFYGPYLWGGRTLLPTDSLSSFEPYRTELSAVSDARWNALQWDALAQYYPWRAFAHATLRRGEIPLWNPYEFCGMPFVANGQSAVFYPFNLIFWLMAPVAAFGVAAWLRTVIAMWGMFFLLRALGRSRLAGALAAMAFGLSGFVVCWQTLPTLVDAAAWLPWSLLAVELLLQRWRWSAALLLAAVTALHLLAGHAQISVYIFLAVALRLLWEICFVEAAKRRKIVRTVCGCVGALVLGILAAAIQLLPLAELSRYGHRHVTASWQGLQAVAASGMPWMHLGALFAPDLLGSPRNGNYVGWAFSTGNYAEFAAYTGAAALALICFAAVNDRRPVRYYAALWAFSLVGSLGVLPVLALLYYTVPGFTQFGTPSRMLVLTCFSAAVLAGAGLDLYRENGQQSARRLWLWGGAAVSVAVAVAALLTASARCASLGWNVPVMDIGLFPLLMGCVWLAVELVLIEGARRSSLAAAALVAVVAADLFVWGNGYNPHGNRERVYPRTPAVEELHRLAGSVGRVVTLSNHWALTGAPPPAALPPNGAMACGLFDVAGYDSLQTAVYKSVAAATEGTMPSPPENGNMLLLHKAESPLFIVAGVRAALARDPIPATALRAAGWRVATTAPPIYTCRDALPRAWVSRGAVPVNTPQDFAAAPALVRARLSAAADLRYDGPNRLAITCPPGAGDTLIVSDAYFPGWHASVNGSPATVTPALVVFRACRVPHGGAKIEMVYVPQSFRLGLYLSLCAIAGLAAAAMWRFVCRRR